MVPGYTYSYSYNEGTYSVTVPDITFVGSGITKGDSSKIWEYYADFAAQLGDGITTELVYSRNGKSQVEVNEMKSFDLKLSFNSDEKEGAGIHVNSSNSKCMRRSYPQGTENPDTYTTWSDSASYFSMGFTLCGFEGKSSSNGKNPSDKDSGIASAIGKAIKKIVVAGIIGIGAIAVIIAVIKGSAAKKAAAAGVKTVVKAASKAATKPKTSQASSTTGLDGVGESYVVTDPATGAQPMYVKDASGQWVSSDGGSVLDTDKLPEWQKQRAADHTWQKASNENLNKPTKFEDIDAKEALENEKIERESYIEKVAIHHGMDTTDMDALYDKISHDQGVAEVQMQKHLDNADDISKVIQVTENLKTVADYSVSALGSVTGPAGTVVKDIYGAGTTIAEDVSQAVADGKDAFDVAQTAAAAVAKSAIGVVQNRASGVIGKATADIVGGVASGGVDAYVKGEDVAQGMTTGGAGGVFSAMVDAGGEMVGALKDGSNLGSLGKDLVSSGSDVTGDFLKKQGSEAIKKSFDKTFKDLKPKE